MENAEVTILNRRLGERLGYVRGGSLPRWAWMWAPDLPFYRARLGKVWVLCKYDVPEMSEQEWRKTVGPGYPYHSNGMYSARMETSLPYGVEPTPEITQAYIRTIGEQMDKSVADFNRELQDKSDKRQERDRLEWVERTQNDVPAFNNWDSGSRAGNVSFGGI